MPQKRRILIRLMAFTALASLVGCVAPGSNVTAVRFTGQLRDGAGQPLAELPIQICLPGSYGLAGLDAAMGRPQDYGHADQWVLLTTGSDGRFSYDFKPVSYSQQVWLFPPLGAVPREPPKPVLGMRTSLGDGEWFIVYCEGDNSRAVRFREQPVERTPLRGNVGKPTLTLRGQATDYPRGWDVAITAVRP